MGRINATEVTIEVMRNGYSYSYPALALQKGNFSPVVKYSHKTLKKMFGDCPEALERYQKLIDRSPRATFRSSTVTNFYSDLLLVIAWYNEYCNGAQ